MKAVQLLVNSVLPEDLRNYDQTYDVKSLNKIMNAVGKKYPEQFDDILHKIANIGRKASYYQGETITLDDLENVIDKDALFAEMDKEIAALPKDKNFTRKRREIFQKYNELMEKETGKAALVNRNNLAMAILSGARGKSPQLKAMVTSPGTYSDYKGEPIDVFSRTSFAEGLSPTAFAASTYGSRAAVVSTKSSTAKGGDLAKQMAQSTVDMVVREKDCGTHNGLVYGIDESTLKGRVLARETAGIPADTLIDREVLHKLRKAGVEEVEARSPLTCSVKHGLCSRCIGKYYNGGKWAPVGTHVGAIASTSSSEPVTQMALCLHANTQVVMADGGFKKIKDIIPGDIVIGSDRKGNQKPVEVVSKFRQGTKKVRVYAAEAYADYSTEDPFSLVPQDYSILLHVTCTPEHKMLMADGSIRPIDECITCAEENLFLNTIYGKAKIVSSSELMDAPCYDIEVDHPDHLFLLANGMITSNSAKHTAGMTQSKKTYSGLDALIQFTQSPEKFKDQGAVSELDGKVENIEEAPQGGMFVTIAGKQHYVPQGHEVEVKVGDKVEAGDQLAEGLVDAEDIVRLKGLGEGRKYYAERLNKMLADSGAATDKRNTEIIARGALRHVRVTNDEGMGDYLPDDVIDYNALQGSYRPSETSQTMAPDAAVGKYLQTPVMHYTIGTRITPKVAANLKKHNHNEIDVDDVEPGFKAEMIRLRASSHTNPDWLASLGTSYLGKQLNEASTKGDDTNVLENVDYRPRLAFGKDFGRKVDQTGIF